MSIATANPLGRDRYVLTIKHFLNIQFKVLIITFSGLTINQ